jgi:serine/threonine protein kinase
MGDLNRQLKKKRRFPEQVAKLYLCEILLAIEYLHGQNILFRDIKPENVLVGEDGHIALTDFGIAKDMGR